MPTTTFAIEPGGPKRLEVRWTGPYQDVAIHFDGAQVGAIPSRAELEKGKSFTLPDRSVLHIELAKSFADLELRLTRDGLPLPGSVSDPAERVRLAGYITLFIALCSGVSGLFAALLNIEALQRRGLGWPSVVEAAILVPLGLLTLRNSKTALVLAITVFTLECVGVLALRAGASGPLPLGLLLRFILLVPMVRGVLAMDELRRPRPLVTKAKG